MVAWTTYGLEAPQTKINAHFLKLMIASYSLPGIAENSSSSMLATCHSLIWKWLSVVMVIPTPLAKTSNLLFLDVCREKERERDKERVIHIKRYMLVSSLLLGGEVGGQAMWSWSPSSHF